MISCKSPINILKADTAFQFFIIPTNPKTSIGGRETKGPSPCLLIGGRETKGFIYFCFER